MLVRDSLVRRVLRWPSAVNRRGTRERLLERITAVTRDWPNEFGHCSDKLVRGPRIGTLHLDQLPDDQVWCVSAMRAVLRGIESPDVDDISTFEPPGPSFSIPLQMIVGPAGSVGEESFDVVVCSPAWLSEKPGPVIGRHLLVVNSFQWKKIRTFLELQVGACEGEDWSEVAKLVGRIGHWEFEDYRP